MVCARQPEFSAGLNFFAKGRKPFTGSAIATMDLQTSGSGACPAGGRPRREIHYQAESAAAAFIGLPEGDDRFAVVRLLREVGRESGWTGRLIEHLELLIGFTRPQDWFCGHRPIVYLQVQSAAERLGLSASQIQRNERRLMQLGAVSFRDSGNFRRYGKRDGDGRLVEAWGLDLSPCAALLPRLKQLAKEVAAEREEFMRLKRRISAARRRIGAAVDCAVADSKLTEEAADAARVELDRLTPRIRARTPLEALRRQEDGLDRLDAQLAVAIGAKEPAAPTPGAPPAPVERPEDLLSGAAEMRAAAAANAAQGPHQRGTQEYYNTNQECTNENITVAGGRPERGADRAACAAPGERAAPETSGGARTVSFSLLLDLLSEEFFGYLPPGRRVGWSELIAAAGLVATDLGISLHAWREACYRLGRQTAATAVVVIAAKKARGLIGSPGGYLRGITRRGLEGELYLERSVFGLAKGGDGYLVQGPEARSA